MSVEPNDRERELARRLVFDGAFRDEIAQQLAEAREGATLPGPRRIVSGHARLSLQQVMNTDALEAVTAHAWRSWFGKLRRHELRPCGWPATQRTYLASGITVLDGEIEVEPDDERAEWLIVSVSCEAVPA